MPTAIVHLPTSEFLPSGHALDAQHALKTVPRNPDPATEKYSGNDADPIVAKTAPEITAAADAAKDADAGQQFDGAKILKAKVLSDLAWRLVKAPGALTPAEIAAERTRIVNIYKGLP